MCTCRGAQFVGYFFEYTDEARNSQGAPVVPPLGGRLDQLNDGSWPRSRGNSQQVRILPAGRSVEPRWHRVAHGISSPRLASQGSPRTPRTPPGPSGTARGTSERQTEVRQTADAPSWISRAINGVPTPRPSTEAVDSLGEEVAEEVDEIEEELGAGGGEAPESFTLWWLQQPTLRGAPPIR